MKKCDLTISNLMDAQSTRHVRLGKVSANESLFHADENSQRDQKLLVWLKVADYAKLPSHEVHHFHTFLSCLKVADRSSIPEISCAVIEPLRRSPYRDNGSMNKAMIVTATAIHVR